ncbi:MAG: choice-of-anchor J domain-containing protein, partial [Bacteroidota bacterium]
MKIKIIISFVLASMAFGLNAQVLFTDNFSSPWSASSQSWIVQNNSVPVGSVSAFQGIGANFPAFNGNINEYVAMDMRSVATNTSGVISTWLMTPTLNLANGTIIEFATRTYAPFAGADRLQLRMSKAGSLTGLATGTAALGNFTTTLLDINPLYSPGTTSAVVNNSVNGYPDAWTVYTVSLSGFVTPTVGRFAFRYFVEDGGYFGTRSAYLGIDAVKVTQDPCFSTTQLTCAATSTVLLPGGTGYPGYPTPYAQKIYSYSPVVSGQHLLNVNNMSNGSIDLYQSTSCGPNVWGASLGALNANSNSTYSLQLNVGTTYYFLLQDMDNNSSNISVSLTCPELTGPCSLISNLDCATPSAFTLAAGLGAWNTKPGNEKVYSFTSAITGQYTLNLAGIIGAVTLYSATVCSATGWTPLSTSSPGNYLIQLSSGNTQYFLIDDNDISLTTGSCSIKCASPDACTAGNYGLSKAASPVDEDIYNVSLGSLNNTSSCTQTVAGQNSILKQYSNFTGIVNAPLLEPGEWYDLSVTLGECGSGSCSDGGISVYIDFDGSGSFNTTTEKVWSKEHCTSNSIAGTTYNTIVYVPLSTPSGYKRMRVIYNCDGLTDPSASYNFGETEDYCLEVRSTVTSLVSQNAFELKVNVFP